MDWMALLAIITSLLLIGFFAGIELAFVSANKLSIELNRKQGTYTGKTWGSFADTPARFIGTTLIGFNVILVVYGLLWSSFMEGIWYNKFWQIDNPYLHLIIETLASTFILLVFEFIFKAFFKARNNAILSNGFLTYIVAFFFYLFAGIATLFVSIAEWILKYFFNVNLTERKEVFSKMDLEYYLMQNKNNGEEEENKEINKELFENALSLSEIKLRECLIPRREIESVQIDTSVEDVRQKFIHTQLSKLVVYENNIDSIVGYIHQLDLFKNPSSLKEILLPIPTVPESMSATDLMNKFSKERKSIAWVIDEFGGTAGIVTMEDILEEIFGDIKDEYDTEEFVEKQLASNEFIFSGRIELDYITEKFKLFFPGEENAETLSGYIIENNGEIPKENQSIIIGNYEFVVLHVSDTRIETVKIKILK
ncbi:MAG: hemolysin family protein [Chitinophagaceae bacterium]